MKVFLMTNVCKGRQHKLKPGQNPCKNGPKRKSTKSMADGVIVEKCVFEEI